MELSKTKFIARVRDVNGLQKKEKEIHDKTMKFENYATLPSVSYCLSLLQTLLTAGCIVFLAFLQIRVTVSFGGQ